MTVPTEPHAEIRSVSRAERSPEGPTATTSADRRLPFSLRVAMVWTDAADVPKEGDGQLHYWRRAPLTGGLASTSGGRDVSFSDLEVR